MRRFMNLSHRLALVAMLGTPLAACGKKDTPPPAALADAQVSPQAEGTTPRTEDPAKTGDQAKPAEEAKPEAPPTPVADPQPAGAPPERAALSTGSIATIPAGIVALAGTPNLGELVKTFAGFVSKIEGTEIPPDALTSFLAGSKEAIGFDLSWVDTDKPLRFAVPDPKKYEDGFIMVFAVKADAKLEPTSFPGGIAGADGHWAKIDVAGRELYLDQVEGHLIATSEDGFFKAHGDFLKQLTAWVPSSPLVLDTSVANLRETFAAELAQGKQMADMIAGMAADPNNPGQAAQIKDMADFGFALVDGMTRLGLAIDPTGDFPRLGITLSGTPESPIGKFAATSHNRKASFATAAPTDAWLVLGYDVPGGGYLSNLDGLVDQITSQEGNPVAPKLNAAEKAELKAKLQKLVELQGSQSASWFRQEGSLPFIFEGISDSPDGAALLGALLDAGDFLFQKMWIQVRKQIVASGVPASEAPENLSFRDFASLFTKNAGQMGVGLEVQDATGKSGAKASGFQLTVDWKRLPMGSEGKVIADLLGNKIGLGFAGHEKFFSAVLGPDAAKRAADVIDRGVPASNTDAWLTRMSANTFFLLLRPARMLKVLATHVPDLAKARGQIDALTDDPFVVSGKSDGTTISIELQMSAKHIEALSLLK